MHVRPIKHVLLPPLPTPAPNGKRPAPQRRQNGFILVATLFAIAIMAIGAAYFASQVDTLRAQATTLSLWADAEAEAFSTREVLVHQFLTSVESRPGWPTVKSIMALDGRRYRLTESLDIAVQDERGLISIAAIDEAILTGFLASVGVPLEQRGRYLDVLADYGDADDLRRLNGAEKNDYIAAGLPPPPNDFPRSRDELRRMLGWQDLIASVESRLGPQAAERFIALFTASRLPGVNLNSAPAPVLSAVTGIVPARVDALLDQRQIKPFTSLAELAPYTQGPISADSAMLIPGASWRVSHVKKGLPFLLECRVILTPMARDRPARVSECQRRAAASIDATWDKRFISVADPTQRQLSRSIDSTANASQRTMDRAAESAARDQTATNENQRNANIQPLDWLSRYLDNAERSTEGANRASGARN